MRLSLCTVSLIVGEIFLLYNKEVHSWRQPGHTAAKWSGYKGDDGPLAPVFGADQPIETADTIIIGDRNDQRREQVIRGRALADGQPGWLGAAGGAPRERHHRHNHGAGIHNRDHLGLNQRPDPEPTTTTSATLGDNNHRYHRSQSAATDDNDDGADNVATINNINNEQLSIESSETNPLIESTSLHDNGHASKLRQREQRKHGQRLSQVDKAGQEQLELAAGRPEMLLDAYSGVLSRNGRQNNNAESIRPLPSAQNDHDGDQGLLAASLSQTPPTASVAGASSRPAKHKGDWCHMNCNINRARDRSKIICASDGRLYSSKCELRRHACRNNVHLLGRPISYCSPIASAKQMPVRPGLADESKHNNSNNNLGALQQHDAMRLIELKRHCNKPEFDEMKLALLHEFNASTESMFKYFDLNNDGFIEAHELWPKADESNRLRYAQAWGEHSPRCRRSLVAPAHHHNNSERSKCWHFLDFAFEPHYPWNPCSLSHLMLFDLSHHQNNRFDLGTFSEAFSGLIGGGSSSSRNNNNSSPSSPTTNGKVALKRFTQLTMNLGDSRLLDCLPDSYQVLRSSNNSQQDHHQVADGAHDGQLSDDPAKACAWTRHNIHLGTIREPHISLERYFVPTAQAEAEAEVSNTTKKWPPSDLKLHINDAQLYLSGRFECSCTWEKTGKQFVHLYAIQVLAEPKVAVVPRFQWSLPNSRVQFECHYDYIDTSVVGRKLTPSETSSSQQDLGERSLFGLNINWLKNEQDIVVDKRFAQLNNETRAQQNNTLPTYASATTLPDFDLPSDAITHSNGGFYDESNEAGDTKQLRRQQPPKLSPSSARASITMASTRLALEDIQVNDTGQFNCRVEVPINNGSSSGNDGGRIVYGESYGSLLVQDQSRAYQQSFGDGNYQEEEEANSDTHLWMFHDNGISVYKLQNDDGLEMELLREINGHSLVSPEVDGNWNQLTLCGGLNQEQVVICEWSDNALYVNVGYHSNTNNKSDSKVRKYIYVGQPNLNRVIVMDGLKFEIVAIINTEPQPRKLFPAKPNKIHLSKWVRLRLSPALNARWLAAIGKHAQELDLTPKSQLYSIVKPNGSAHGRRQLAKRHAYTMNQHQAPTGDLAQSRLTNQVPSKLIQHDIWLLCYGQPLVVNPSGDEHLDDSSGSFYSPNSVRVTQIENSNSSGSATLNPIHKRSSRNVSAASAPGGSSASVQPFTPRLSHRGPLVWSVPWPSGAANTREARLRNRKSVQIIQSTFFPSLLRDDSMHEHTSEGDNIDVEQQQHRDRRRRVDITTVGEFKRLTVLTTHYVFTGTISSGIVTKATTTKKAQQQQQQQQQHYLNQAQVDLIQDLSVPSKPFSLMEDARHKIHYAYVTHYDEQRLYRVSMDEYRYNREIDLQDCDPINLVTTAQGLLVVQCRAPIAHNLIGQLVLDELTSSRIEFNTNIRAQESYLSPDNRYLVSIYTNTTVPYASNNVSFNQSGHHGKDRRSATTAENDAKQQWRQSIIYVQLISVDGLKLQYEVKTSLEISQCSFVWKDGYYAAIFVSTNRREQQSELLSLRLADSRLELMVRVPGLISTSRHKASLNVLHGLQIAALSTNQGTYIVDLAENRVTQTLHHHQSTPTLLWV